MPRAGVILIAKGLVAAIERVRSGSQYYFLARSVGEAFGTGGGPEMGSAADSESGSCRAVWLATDSLLSNDLRPRSLARRLRRSAELTSWRALLIDPLVIHEQPLPPASSTMSRH